MKLLDYSERIEYNECTQDIVFPNETTRCSGYCREVIVFNPLQSKGIKYINPCEKAEKKMQKLQQRLDLQEHVLRCTDVHDGYHPRNTNDNRCEIECVREFLKDGFYFGAKFVRELTDDEIRDFIGWVRVNGRVSRVDIPMSQCRICASWTRNVVPRGYTDMGYVCEECDQHEPF